jgi:hypothetical protein
MPVVSVLGEFKFSSRVALEKAVALPGRRSFGTSDDPYYFRVILFEEVS